MSTSKKRFFLQWSVIITGIAAGIIGPLLQYFGNPKNMGFCIACMERDIAGALGLHRAAQVQYLRPEIPGIVLGALIASLLFREFRARTGSAPIIRFVLGFFTMIGALVFLGCPWRALLRIAGGDLTAVAGLAGLAVGVYIGVHLLKFGYDLGRSYRANQLVGWAFPVLTICLVVLCFVPVQFANGGPIFASTEGPGAAHAPVVLSVIGGLVVGILAQRSRFCTIGSFRDLYLMGDTHLVRGVIAFVLAAAGMNLLLHQFNLGVTSQPIAHAAHIWNFMGLLLVGLASTLGGGCPARQLVLAGEGDGDAAVFVLGMLAGAAFSHNFTFASTSAGVSTLGPVVVIAGVLICLVIGLAMREEGAK